jgi:hypothetical protein
MKRWFAKEWLILCGLFLAMAAYNFSVSDSRTPEYLRKTIDEFQQDLKDKEERISWLRNQVREEKSKGPRADPQIIKATNESVDFEHTLLFNKKFRIYELQSELVRKTIVWWRIPLFLYLFIQFIRIGLWAIRTVRTKPLAAP